MYTAFVYDDCSPRASFVLPWVDILPTDSLNLPVRISIDEGGTSQSVAVVIALVMAALIGLLAHLLVFRPAAQRPGPRQGHRLGRPHALPAGGGAA